MESNIFCSERLSSAQRGAMDFLLSHLPQSDLDCYDASLFLAFADHALALRENAPWCAALDEEIFYHYVLFPRVNDEYLSFHREIFRAALWERICEFDSVEEKVLEVNRWCHEIASYEMQDDRTASPLTVFRCGSGRCGEESAFLVSALRSVGIPARQVYAPRWAHCDDNHAWVETLCGGEWRFLGACEPEPVLNRGWFNSPASRALLVHSRMFGAGDHPLHGEKLGSAGCVTWYNQTARYALTRRVTLRAFVDGERAAGAEFQIQVLNEASFHTIATLTADERGEASLALGIGDFRAFARLGDRCAECDCRSDTLELALESVQTADTGWQTADYTAPPDAPVNSLMLSGEQKRERAAVLADGRKKREARIAAMFPVSEQGTPRADLLRAARGNSARVHAFLSGGEGREKLLRTLTKKDLRDVTTEVLEAHLKTCVPQGDLPDELYFSYVLCPRISLEPLKPWRKALGDALAADERALFRADPAALWNMLLDRMEVSSARTYENLICTPAEAWKARRCDARSLRVLFVALLRTLGVPARLRTFDGEAEFYRSGQWRTIGQSSCALLTVHGDGAIYRLNWTLSRRDARGWTLLQPEDGAQELMLPEGRYRLQTGIRMPNGNQFAALRDFTLRDGERKEIDLLFRSYELSDLLSRTRLPVMSAVTLAGEHVEDICRLNGRTSLLLWSEEGGEPTEHILLELAAAGEDFRALGINVVFLLRGKDSLRHAALAAAAEKLHAVCLLPEDWSFDLEQTARQLTCDPDTPPLAVVCDKNGNAVYGMSGYRVGAVELLRRIAEHVENEV